MKDASILMKPTAIRFLLIGFLFLTGFNLSAQNNRKKLEQRKVALQNEINQINKSLRQTKKTEKTALVVYEKITRKISVRNQLIRQLRREINGISHRINKNEKTISTLDSEVSALKKEYAQMIQRAYNSRSRDNKMYFVFSSKSFYQAFKRMQYLKQYNNYRKEQAQKIQDKKKELVLLKNELNQKRTEKRKVFHNYQKEEAIIKVEQQKQLELVNQIKKKKNVFLKRIKSKQREQVKIDKLIDKLIRKAIVKSNKKVVRSKRQVSRFFLTPEGKKLANKFSTNRGILPWPVKKAYISRKFGVQQHEIFKNIKVENSGIYLATESNAKVRAIFEGIVLQIQVIPGGNSTVFIKHGNYLSIYGNLKDVYVKPGEKIKTKQEIGTVATNPTSKKTELKFRIYKNMTKLNPEKWLQKR